MSRARVWGRGREPGGRGNATLSRAPRPAPRAPERGFSLVELLVVIAIIGILTGLGFAGVQSARRRGAVTKAKTTIAGLETAIANYEADMGDYPSTGNGALMAALQEGGGEADWAGPYFEPKQDELKEGQLVDPWGQPYEYVSVNEGAPEHRTRSFDLWSYGPNGADDDGTGDDIYNW
ncbi:MAG: type II secretion system protein GspG [Candidatus Omnitrophica bacterium CG11_big_fil_rev_8_21_14_0_20_63_9]|nr:MAG: type II secretion system protein GspG [Candidatus Omnitrophica bacterium CG11_big_fil_rev_8_21_14_0_20_63_9]